MFEYYDSEREISAQHRVGIESDRVESAVTKKEIAQCHQILELCTAKIFLDSTQTSNRSLSSGRLSAYQCALFLRGAREASDKRFSGTTSASAGAICFSYRPTNPSIRWRVFGAEASLLLIAEWPGPSRGTRRLTILRLARIDSRSAFGSITVNVSEIEASSDKEPTEGTCSRIGAAQDGASDSIISLV